MDYSYDTSRYSNNYQTYDPAMLIGILMGYFIFFLIFYVVMVITYWKLFTKAGQPGWAALIPIYNIYILLKVVKRPGWWLLLLFIPFVNIIIHIIVALDLAKVFGRSAAFGIFLNLLFPIGPLIIAFGKSTYSK